ncbi:MAG: hypothetical protein V4463_23040 [Pseudomonadota bacterium]
MKTLSAESREGLRLALVQAALLIVIALLMRYGWLDREFGARGCGALMGMIVLAFGNVIPKRASFARPLQVRRIAGWSLVLSGLAYALCWLLLPLGVGGDAALACLMAGCLYGLARICWICFVRRTVPPTP